MPKQLIIIGAGGFSRETADAVRAAGDEWDLLGFADDDPTRHGKRLEGVEVLGPIDEVVRHVVAPRPDCLVVVCTGRPDNYFSRFRIVDRLGLPPERYATVVHPDASLGVSSRVGPGSVILAGTVVTAAASIGAHVAIMPGCVITHDDVIEDFATVASGARLGGSVRLGKGAYLGAGVMIREGLSVGEWSFVGMGALVTRTIPAGERWWGSPARPMGNVDVPLAIRPSPGR